MSGAIEATKSAKEETPGPSPTMCGWQACWEGHGRAELRDYTQLGTVRGPVVTTVQLVPHCWLLCLAISQTITLHLPGLPGVDSVLVSTTAASWAVSLIAWQ